MQKKKKKAMINTSSLFLQICNIIPKEMGSVHLGKIKPVTALLFCDCKN